MGQKLHGSAAASRRSSRRQVPESAHSSTSQWQSIQSEFNARRYPSLRALASASGVSYDALKRRARGERWAASRARHEIETRRARLDAAVADALAISAAFARAASRAPSHRLERLARRAHLAFGEVWERLSAHNGRTQ